ncbi:DUF1015 domain-containing protein [Treponema sp.]|uniref:DUF1015 domain-containing protein n=1 Tax=Treponema sp. TaxID=166 RepID=UPI0025D0603C|nr:DUF1015 domain-containing protein [Treponema sp.]MCR5218640.1 DUF1015 domain-containing protein [Treponema sp.]
MKAFEEFGVKVPEILLPKDKDLSSWSVIACDQYTQDEEYWKRAEKAAAGKASTLNLILPEVYLSAPDRKERIQKIRQTMKDYINGNVFDPADECFVYLERKTGYGRVRHGLVCAIDLDCYEWKPFSKALIRATEATIVDRIPPRKEIRMNAPLELPHIMLLVNDPEHKLVEKTGELVKDDSPAYDGDLMLDAGHIKGWKVKGANLDSVYDSLSQLKKENTQKDSSVFLFAVGDGNHSLATAKAVWDEYKAACLASGKSEEEVNASPVRYALVEIVNIYDSGLTFEPIHRVLFNTDADELCQAVKASLGGNVSQCSGPEELEKKVHDSKANFGFVSSKDGKPSYLLLETPVTELAVSRFQPVVDSFIAAKKESGTNVEIDYIHGSDEVFRLGKKDNTVSVLLPPVAKDSFFTTIGSSGPLPRKSFSMGEASEKRFYLECRKLF